MVGAREARMEAYVLIQTEVGRASEVATAVAGLDGVVVAEAVVGPYDVIIRVQAESVDALGKRVVSRIQLIVGVARTITCPIIHL
jgi:DNA-binding Lrp family transcriptional regulator